MKTPIDKSRVMKRAWNIFRGNAPYSYRFSDSLRRAWAVEKANIAYQTKQLREAIEKAEREAKRAERRDNPVEMVEVFGADVNNWYSNAPRGTYFGD